MLILYHADPGPDLDLWGPLGRLRCGGPKSLKNINFMEAKIPSSEASES